MIRDEKSKVEQEKSLGPLYFLYRKSEYRPIGPRAEDFIESDQNLLNAENVFKNSKTLDEFKAAFWAGIESSVRPKAWRTILQYTPLSSQNGAAILLKKRVEYKEYVQMNTEEKYIAQNDSSIIETIKLIKKDVLRTLPESHIFRNRVVQNSMVRMLLIYSIRHPSNFYSQGMNDILAPLFVVFMSEKFSFTYIELENRIKEVEDQLTEDSLLDVE